MDLATLQKISTQILSREVPIYKRYLYSKIDFNSKLIGIKGARGAGKSTILLQYAKSLELPNSKILYVSCDHPAMSGVSLYDIAEAFYARGGKLFIIDEIFLFSYNWFFVFTIKYAKKYCTNLCFKQWLYV